MGQTFVHEGWEQQLKKSEKPLWKYLISLTLRRIWDSRARARLEDAELHKSVTKIISERGYYLTERRKWATAGLNLNETTILVQGTGNGWDAVTWARLRPKKIIAVDLYAFDTWREVSTYCEKNYNVSVEFVESPIEKDFGIASGSIDLVVSDAVYEHCRDLSAVMHETNRLLRPGGRVYANYGPLWYCASGDHFSGRDKLSSCYNHLILSQEEYRNYFESNRKGNESFQDGGRYVELDLFSKLSTQEYANLYMETGFKIEDLWIEVSAKAAKFREAYNEKFKAMGVTLAGSINANDFLIKAHHIRLSKPSG